MNSHKRASSKRSVLPGLVLLLAISACSGPNDTSYKMVGPPEDLSFPGAKRFTARIVIPEGRTRQEVVATLERAARELSDKTGADAVSIFGYRPDDPTDGAYSVGMSTLAPGGDWGEAATKGEKKISTELGELYFAKTNPQPAISDIVVLRKDDSSPIAISRSYKSWRDTDIITKVPSGTKAEILEVWKETISGDDEIMRFRVKSKTSVPAEGWVHDFEAGYK